MESIVADTNATEIKIDIPDNQDYSRVNPKVYELYDEDPFIFPDVFRYSGKKERERIEYLKKAVSSK